MVSALKDKKIVEIAEKALSKYKLCDHCLGRLFAMVEHGFTNEERGEKLRRNLKQYRKIEIKDCWLCSGLFNEIRHFADIISE
ncbi:MAG: hypothetical protein KAW47_00455, partial [Thermoplasmatales archaeon]|nr:hypothetical protein [Thermoplasmatales archaeon]